MVTTLKERHTKVILHDRSKLEKSLFSLCLVFWLLKEIHMDTLKRVNLLIHDSLWESSQSFITVTKLPPFPASADTCSTDNNYTNVHQDSMIKDRQGKSNIVYSVTRAIKDCWLDQSEWVNKSDHVEFFIFFIESTAYVTKNL